MGHVAVIGAGFAGAVIARECAAHGLKVDVYEARDHIAGNCFTERDRETGVMVHKYGPHIFHTADERVWKYINCFGEMMPYNHRVKAVHSGSVYSMPINLHTINQFYRSEFSPYAAQMLIDSKRKLISEPKNFEEQALSMIGPDLYEAFLRGYTIKQWGRSPCDLPASVLKRLPLRFDYNDSYFAHPYQAIPKHGYTEIVGAILDHKDIYVHLGMPMTADKMERLKYDHVFYSGPLDAWFNHVHGRLAYRTLDFTTEITKYGLGCPVMNYCDITIPYTRRTDFRHFTPWETPGEKSLIYWEYSREARPESDDVLYYPIRLANDTEILKQYAERVAAEHRTTFIGRLGTYRYLDMDVTIAESLAVADKFLKRPSHAIQAPHPVRVPPRLA